jgi:hypothetical protein
LLLPASPVEYSTHLQQSSSIFPCNLCLAPHQVDEKITLCGMNDAPFFIVGRLVTLSCLGDMLGKPVFAFSLVKSIVHSGRGSQRTYDISASIEVIIGMVYSRFSMCRRLQLTFNRSVGACKTRPQGWSLGLVRMVGGTLYRTNESGDRADWSLQDAESSGTLSSLQRKLRIGAINRTGYQSNMSMGDTIELRTPMLEPIETTNPSWNLQRLQAGLQRWQIATMANCNDGIQRHSFSVIRNVTEVSHIGQDKPRLFWVLGPAVWPESEYLQGSRPESSTAYPSSRSDAYRCLSPTQ